MAEDEKKEPEQKRSAPSRSTAAKKSSPEVPREELKGVIRTSRIGTIEDRPHELDPVDERHRRLAEAPQPGDENYNPYTDPLIPTSSLQQIVATELAGSGESATWDALHKEEEREAGRRAALRKFDEDYAEAS